MKGARHSKRKTVGIVGLGYVGLPLACLAAEKGYRVIGLAREAQKVEQINKKISPIQDVRLRRWLKRVDFQATVDPAALRVCSTIIICVPTPVDHLYNPDLGPVRNAAEMIRRHARKSTLVILESTVNPGVSEEIIQPILERGGWREGRDFFLAHCPERINPGDQKWMVRNIPRVIGAVSTRGLKEAVRFYKSILEASVRPMQTIKAAEAVKILENSFRDINIAFINEIAMSFYKLGIDVMDVIEGAKTKPFAFMAHYPSCGVGGHCIPVDPYYLIERARQTGFDHKFLKYAREINNSMPAYTVTLLVDALNRIGLPLKGTPVAVLGLAYKGNIEDTRESPAYVIIEQLRQMGADLRIFDPRVPKESNCGSLDGALRGAVATVLVTPHDEFRSITPKQLKSHGVRAVIDGKNVWDKTEIQKLGIIYRGIGR